LAKQPGAAVSEISKKLGISSQQGHGIVKRLREKGEIKKQGKGYALKG
jgi:predicted transcriptional regulator